MTRRNLSILKTIATTIPNIVLLLLLLLLLASRAHTAEPLLDRKAPYSAEHVDLWSIVQIVGFIEAAYGVKISIEPLPEQRAGTTESEVVPPSFELIEGEGFLETIGRLEAATQGRWIFEEIHGMPILRPDSTLAGHGNLLNTQVSVDIEAQSVWEAFCALAQAVNAANDIHRSRTRPLAITFSSPAFLFHPLPLFLEERPINLSLKNVMAREALCAILETLDVPTQYLYHGAVEGATQTHDYITVDAYNQSGHIMNGGRIRDDEFRTLLDSEAWMSDTGLLALQAPLDNSAGSPLLDRTASNGMVLDAPKNVYTLNRSIEKAFDVRLSTEPLPENCSGSSLTEIILPDFEIVAGETFESVMRRFEMTTQGRWHFEEIHGIPVLHPDTQLAGHGTLLDTIVTLDIKAESMWEALCALALTINETNEVHRSGTPPLLITFSSTAYMKYPPPLFIEKAAVVLSLDQITAREALCLILRHGGENIQYRYHCIPNGSTQAYPYITISAYDDEGHVVNGATIRDDAFVQLLETKAWMSEPGVAALQVPLK